MGSRRESRIYIGNLPSDVKQRDLEDLFYKYGRINYIDIKLSRGAPFAFIEFDDPRFALLYTCLHLFYSFFLGGGEGK